MKRVRRVTLAVLGTVALLAVGVPYILPVPPLRGTLPPQALAGPDGRFIEINGVRLYYELHGSGKPVYLLLHGFGAHTYSWREVIAPLARQGTVLVPDRPGYGLTERIIPSGHDIDNPYSVQGQAVLFAALLDALGISEVIAVGHSAGGTVALQLALDYPSRVRALVLEDAAVFHLERRVGIIQPLIRSRWAYRLGRLFSRSAVNRAEAFARLAWYDYSKAPADYLEQYLMPLRSENWDIGLWEATRAMQPLDQVERLGQLTIPVLVLTGEEDRVVPAADAARLAGGIAGSAFSSIPRCGHIPHEECPEGFLAALDNFTKSLPPMRP